MKIDTAILADGRRVPFITDPIGEGGFKVVYFTQDKQSVVCFFKDQSTAVDPNRQSRLENIVGRYNPTVEAGKATYFADLFCWPTGIIVKPLFGVMAPAYSKNFFFAEGKFKGKEKEGKWFSSPKLRKLLPSSERGNWRNYLDMCKLMARGIRRMHLAGLAHSDLSSRNVLVDPPNGRCAIIDVDSLVVPGTYPPDVLGTPGYIAPEVMATQQLAATDANRKLPSNTTDLHALSVLIYEYLLRRHPLRGPKIHAQDPGEDDRLAFGSKAVFIEHPTDTSNRPQGLAPSCDHLGPYLKDLVIKAFVVGLHDPARRPPAQAWEAALGRTSDLLIPCENPACEERWYVFLEGQKPQCPWCGKPPKSALPVLDFHYAPRRGQFVPEKHCIVGYHDRGLYPWHIHSTARDVEDAPAEVQAKIMQHQGQWILYNLKLTSLVSPKGNPVPINQACVLRPGEEVLLSKDEKGKLVSVRMIG